MEHNVTRWRLRSPGNLDLELNEISSTPVEPAVKALTAAAKRWGQSSFAERLECLRSAQRKLTDVAADLAQSISLETGKPIREANGELAAVVAKFDLTFEDAQAHLREAALLDLTHPALVRQRPRGPAAVVGPFNFPLHLAHGAITAHLMAGNPVAFKPSPLAANTAARYAQIMAEALPPGVFELVQGGAEEGWALCTHPDIRSVAFTGSVPVGRKLACALAADLGKDLALELGGKNAALICADANLQLAADAVAEAACLTTGQRCNATSRVLVDAAVVEDFIARLLVALGRFVPGDPMLETTRLGPLVQAAAVARYQTLTASRADWLMPGEVLGQANGKRGHYVRPAVALLKTPAEALGSPLFQEEAFAPILTLVPVKSLGEAIALTNASSFGLSAAVFTSSEQNFRRIADELEVANVYANLPTTLSPSTLPFGGWKDSGNRHPGGRHFIRFTSDEQVVQMGRDTFRPEE